MDQERNAITGTLTITESSLPMRLLGGCIAAVGIIAMFVMPLDAEVMQRLVFGIMTVVGIGIALMAVGRSTVYDPRTNDLRIERCGIMGETIERIPVARIERLRIESGSSVDTSGAGYVRTFCLVADLKTGERVDLSSSASWHRDAKRAAGDALARATGVAFEADRDGDGARVARRPT